MLDEPREFELRILFKINSFDSKFADIFFKIMGYFGHLLFWYLVIGYFGILGLRSSHFHILLGLGLEPFNIAVLLAIGLGIDALASNILQYLFNRKRPFKTIDLVENEFNVRSWELTPSFPSAHTHRAFFCVTLLIWGGFEWAFFLYIISCIAGISRLYLGAHYPLDVIFGGIFGIINSTVYFFLSQSFISWVSINIALISTKLNIFDLIIFGILAIISIIIGFYLYLRYRIRYKRKMTAKYGIINKKSN